MNANVKTQASNDYDASKITVLEGLAPVRKRPGMYIGGTGIDGLHHLVWEVVDNAIDEAMSGFCDKVSVQLNADGSVTVNDNGRGIPVDKHKTTGKSALETVLTTLHAGGKFGEGGYKVSGGLHGVGVSVVNALSVWIKVEVRRGGKTYYQEYQRGKAISDIKIIGDSADTGTKITFMPDSQIFENINFNYQTILTHCRQQAYLTKGVMIRVSDLRVEEENQSEKINDEIEGTQTEEETEGIEKDMRTGRGGANEKTDKSQNRQRDFTFYFEGGIKSYVKHINKAKNPLNSPPFYVEKEQDGVLVELSLAYTDDYKEHIYTFANNINTAEGGTHLTGLKTALTRAINDYGKKTGLLKNIALSGEDVREGLTAVLSIKLRDPQFEGQTKAKLGNTEVRAIVETVSASALASYLEENPNEGKRILEKCSISARARMAAKAARDTIIRKGALEGMTLPGKLADCSSRDPKKCEVYIVEGDSAGGSAKQGRDRMFQAILPLRGKILNVERARLDRMLGSDEIKALIVAMGIGVGEDTDYSKLRYDRIIIMTDADVDGAHIRTLLLTFLFRNYPELIERGHVYIAQPPLFSITKGKEKYWAYSDAERDQYLKKMRGDKKDNTGITIQRYKGLGEMNPTQLWNTTMDPAHRILLQVVSDDAELADETFSMLMGDQVLPRRRFIQAEAKSVKNLDI